MKRSSNVLSSASRESNEEWNACARGDRRRAVSIGRARSSGTARYGCTHADGMAAAGAWAFLRGVRPVYSCLHFDLYRRFQWMRDSVATEKYIRVLQELPAHRAHGKGWPSAWVTRLHARASTTTARGAAHVRIMWPRVWSSLSMTNMAALGTLVSLITTTFSRLPSSGIRQQSKSSGLFVIGAARGEAGDLARVRAGAAPLPPTRRRWGGQQRPHSVTVTVTVIHST